MSGQAIYDLFVIGGGINGCGIARRHVSRSLCRHICRRLHLCRCTTLATHTAVNFLINIALTLQNFIKLISMRFGDTTQITDFVK